MALRESALFSREVIAEIQRAAREGIYDIRGFGAKRKLPHFDDLLFLGASISRYPLEGYREKCGTDVVLGTRYAIVNPACVMLSRWLPYWICEALPAGSVPPTSRSGVVEMTAGIDEAVRYQPAGNTTELRGRPKLRSKTSSSPTSL